MAAQFIRHPGTPVGQEGLYRFRKSYHLEAPKTGKIRIMAEARYKLWINDCFVACGPCKGSRHRRYYDEVEIGPFLKTGENHLRVELLTLTTQDNMEGHRGNLCSVLRSGEVYLYIDGVADDNGTPVAIGTDGTWESAEETHVSFTEQFFVGMNEHITPGFGEDLAWGPCQVLDATARVEGDTIPWGEILSTMAKPRPIPMMNYIPHKFKENNGYLDAGRVMTGYIRMHAKGKGKITLTYGECFVTGDNEIYEKGDRADTTQTLFGHNDTFLVDGELQFESFWFRTFRFVKVACEGAVEVTHLSYAETGYPLHVSDNYDFGNAQDNALWDISLCTLRRCMQETYVDCPYYEQLQYCMDTYSETLYTYMISNDLRLAKRAIDDFAMTWYPGGLTEARAPSCKRQYIPGFSLFFILMVNMYEARSGNTQDIKPYMPVVDGILNWFDTHRNEFGLVKVSGLWDFVDWSAPWKQDEGAPITSKGEGISVYSLMYAYALQKAARLAQVLGRSGVAGEYLDRREEILQCVKIHCHDKESGLYWDSEKQTQYSQHTQIWAVLSGLVTDEAARSLLAKSTTLEAQGGYAYAYLWFRALEKAGCYALSEERMNELRSLLDMHCTTIPETPYRDSRSECHAWGAVALYEFTTMVLGVKLKDDHTNGICIAPYVKDRDHATGNVYTRFGMVNVAWRTWEGCFSMEVVAPDGVPVDIYVPDGFHTYDVSLNGKPMPVSCQ